MGDKVDFSSYERGVCAGLARLEWLCAENSEIPLLENTRLVVGSRLASPIATALKGDDCLSQRQITEYQDKNGTGHTPLISAYHGSTEKREYALTYSCSPMYSEFYLEIIMDGFDKKGSKQFDLERSYISAISSLLIFSEFSIETIAPVFIESFPKMKAYATLSSEYKIRNIYKGITRPFLIRKQKEGELAQITEHIKSEKIPEAYLASMRVLRAINRKDADDCLVDLIIALEALFSEDGSQGIQFRVSQRTNQILEIEKEERRNTRELILKAYKRRSDLVHGNKMQIGLIQEEMIEDGHKKQKNISSEELHKLNKDLIYLLCLILKKRYLKYGEMNKRQLLAHLDELAV